MSGALLVSVMRHPARASQLTPAEWNAVIAAARAEQMFGNLAARLQDQKVPARVAPIIADARSEAAAARRRALWEVDRAREAIEPLGVPMILLKGSAYAAAGLKAGEGRSIGDLDILVPRTSLDRVEAALLAAGWEWVKPDPYDDAYYRQWMHELPPLIHRERDRMIDVHHTILPLTARPKPDAEAMIRDRATLADGLQVLGPNDMIVHAAAHLFADGDLSGGVRNLWDIHCLIGEFGVGGLAHRARQHGLWLAVSRAAAQAHQLYGTDIPDSWRLGDSFDVHFRRRLLARDGWGRPTRPLTRLGFYIRSHWLRMPPHMLARHLLTKWRKRSG